MKVSASRLFHWLRLVFSSHTTLNFYVKWWIAHSFLSSLGLCFIRIYHLLFNLFHFNNNLSEPEPPTPRQLPVFLITHSSTLLWCGCSFFLTASHTKLFLQMSPMTSQLQSFKSRGAHFHPSCLIWSLCIFGIAACYFLKCSSVGSSVPVSPGSPSIAWPSPFQSHLLFVWILSPTLLNIDVSLGSVAWPSFFLL